MLKQWTAGIVLAALLGAAGPQSSASAWFGAWRLRALDDGGKPETLIYSDAGNGAMRMVSVEAQSVIVTRFDGAPAADVGPVAKAGNALAVRATSPTSYAWIFWSGGKPFVEGFNVLAEDRRSFKETSWLVENPDDKVTLVYERQ